MSSIALADILHFISIDHNLQHLLPVYFRKKPATFKIALNYIFDIQRREELKAMVGFPVRTDPNYIPVQQEEVDFAMSWVAAHMHANLSSEGKEYLISRGITEDQINEYGIGDNLHSVPYLEDVEKLLIGLHVDPELVSRIKSALGMYNREVVERYGSGHAISFPSFDSSGEFTGVVYRSVHFQKRNMYRNMYKFYSPYNYSFLFNERALEEHDHVYMVEGVADALALIRLGYVNVISPSMVRITDAHVEKIAHSKCDVSVLFDRDSGGFAGLMHVLSKLPKDKIRHAALTPNGVDFDEEDPKEIHHYMAHLDDYDVRHLIDKPKSETRDADDSDGDTADDPSPEPPSLV